ncbi:MAG: 50S ribosomal protein L21 [Proteobacteria bacterium]|nr:50S ribosomal protein L21 [Pseudomonadota bacterium]
MYAVFKTGGKQYRAATGDILKIEKIEAEKGALIDLDEVLMVGEGDDVQVGAPFLEGTKVTAKVLEQGRRDKITIIKFKRRKHHRKQAGHRQYFTCIQIEDVVTGAKKATKKAEKKAAPKKVKVEKPAKTDAAPALRFLDAAIDGKADDLKKISGVGPVLEGKLNNLGIYHYSQVAAFTAGEIEQIDAELNFKGRIDRDDWLGQAKALAAGSDAE